VADIPGLKGLRLMEGQPVALGPFGADFSQGKRHRLELELNDGSIHNIEISATAYKELLAGFARQGVTIEQRLMARAVVASEQDRTVVAEKAMPLDVTPKQAVEALKEVGRPPEPAKELTWREVLDHEDDHHEAYDFYDHDHPPEEEDE
jgi:hypothetical protein